MKALFLNPAYGEGFCKSARWFARSRGRVQRHPDYLCTAIAVLEADGHTCRFIDGAAKEASKAETLNAAVDFRPQMVVIQATTPSIYSDLGYASACKAALGQECLTVLVGAHGSAEPEDTLRKSAGLDVVARGEYDYTLRDLARAIDGSSGGLNAASLEKIPGLSFLPDGAAVSTPDRPLLDVNTLPFPAWRHIDPHDYPDAGKLFPFITLLGGRGCDGRCTFCLFPQVMYGRQYRPRDVGLVVDEIEYDLALFPYLKEVMFEDDTLTAVKHEARLEALCNEIMRRRLKITWSANARADLDDLETFKLMKRAGCRMLCVGFEFGSQEVLNNVKKGVKLDRMRQFAVLCRKAGIRVHGCFMIGGPGETRQTAQETIAFARSLPIDTVQFSGVCAYPGTEFYRWATENGYLVPRDWPEWVDSNLEQRSIVSYPQLSSDEINALVDRGLKDFYLRPGQVLAITRNIRSWSDFRTKLYGLRSFVQYLSTGGKRTSGESRPVSRGSDARHD